MIVYGYIPNWKNRRVLKSKKLQHEEWLVSMQSMTTNFSKTKSKKTTGAFSSPKIPAGRESPKYESLDTGFITCGKTFQKYTGEKMMGIATMHKSNAVPVFTDNEAKEIASMRR